MLQAIMQWTLSAMMSKSKNGGDSWGTFVQKDIKTEVLHYAYGE